MKNSYLLFVLVVLLSVISCSDDDYKKPPITTNSEANLWPLADFSFWLLTKDTINDTIRVDTSYCQNITTYFEAKGMSKFFLPNSIPATSTLLYVTDSIYYMQIPEINDPINPQNIVNSSYAIPIVNDKLSVGEEFYETTTYNQTFSNHLASVKVISSSLLLDKNCLEAVGGQVFTNVTKVKNTYTYEFDSYTQILNREIWFQRGVGPIKIIDLNNTISYLITAYQLPENQTIL